jgi:hypothetical protein
MPKIVWVHMAYQDENGMVTMINFPPGGEMEIVFDMERPEPLDLAMPPQQARITEPTTVTMSVKARSGISQTTPLYTMREMR